MTPSGTDPSCYASIALNSTGLAALQTAINNSTSTSYFTLGGSIVTSLPASNVPEPASMVLLASGLAALTGRRLRRR
jgi:hypothetical protein